jgi:integrase/recombinase XerD
VRRIVYAAAAQAGLGRKASPDWMRHAHASHALDRRAPIHLVQSTLGHAPVSTTGRYLHARPTESSSFYLPD